MSAQCLFVFFSLLSFQPGARHGRGLRDCILIAAAIKGLLSPTLADFFSSLFPRHSCLFGAYSPRLRLFFLFVLILVDAKMYIWHEVTSRNCLWDRLATDHVPSVAYVFQHRIRFSRQQHLEAITIMA